MTTLTDRYVHATLRSVPEGRRADIGPELRASIADMMEARMAAIGEPEADAERAVLTELGDPEKLAGKYTEGRSFLLGPPYFAVWRRLTRTLLTWIPAVLGLLSAVLELSDGGSAGDAISAGLSAAFGIAVQVVFWTTLVFAILDWTDTPLGSTSWDVDQLPEAPRARQVTLGDTAVSIGFAVVVAGLISLQQVRPWFTDESGDRVSVLDPALWSSWIPVLLAALAAGVVLDVVRYRTGRWTMRQAVANVAINLAFAAPVVWLLLEDRLFNADFVAAVGMSDEAFGYLTNGTLIGVLVVAGWDIIEGFVKTFPSGRPHTDDAELTARMP